MVFFRNDPPEENPEKGFRSSDGTADATQPQDYFHSGRTTPIFKQASPVDSANRLSPPPWRGRARVGGEPSKGHHSESTPSNAPDESFPPTLALPRQGGGDRSRPTIWAGRELSQRYTETEGAFQALTPPKAPEEGTEGQFLNTIDGDLTAGLERYFPSPAFRLRVSQRRLSQQLKALRKEYDEYNRLPGKTPEMFVRQKNLLRRLAVVEYRERRVSRELASLLVMGGFFTGLFDRIHQVTDLFPKIARILQRETIKLIRGKKALALSEANQELQSIYHILSSRLKDPQTSPAELGRILNLYDRLYAQAVKNSKERR